ncbi:MAG TPA: XRE family transcriptional regulator [Spirochaetia bacterium]|nr:MAG: transcriptional regulator [Spirochaetes bacterium GWB1_36_13]HCL55630.1 XRE family transcriptional regulator [Spirochaetia bacterium]
MKTFKKHLNEKLNDIKFQEMYDEEKKLLEISLKIHDEREKHGLSQNEVAKKAHITQQQLSKIENGENCNVLTLLKVCHALGLKLDFIKNKDHQYV